MRLIVSVRAEADLRDILRYGAGRWGIERGARYVRIFRGKLGLLVDNPKLGAQADHIRPGLRRYPYISHVAYYRIIGDEIRIVRILHKQMLQEGQFR
jgi:toxin ParE1/3/4